MFRKIFKLRVLCLLAMLGTAQATELLQPQEAEFEAQLRKASSLIKVGRSGAALKLLNQLKPGGKLQARVYFQKGRAFAHQKKYKKAVKLMNKAIRLNNELYSAYFNGACYSSLAGNVEASLNFLMGLAQQTIGRPEVALKYRRLARIDPDLFKARQSHEFEDVVLMLKYSLSQKDYQRYMGYTRAVDESRRVAASAPIQKILNKNGFLAVSAKNDESFSLESATTLLRSELIMRDRGVFSLFDNDQNLLQLQPLSELNATNLIDLQAVSFWQADPISGQMLRVSLFEKLKRLKLSHLLTDGKNKKSVTMIGTKVTLTPMGYEEFSEAFFLISRRGTFAKNSGVLFIQLSGRGMEAQLYTAKAHWQINRQAELKKPLIEEESSLQNENDFWQRTVSIQIPVEFDAPPSPVKDWLQLKLRRRVKSSTSFQVHYYKQMSSKNASALHEDLKIIKEKLAAISLRPRKVELVMVGNAPGKPSEYLGVKVQERQWWNQFWQSLRPLPFYDGEFARQKIRSVLGPEHEMKQVNDLYLKDILRLDGSMKSYVH